MSGWTFPHEASSQVDFHRRTPNSFFQSYSYQRQYGFTPPVTFPSTYTTPGNCSGSLPSYVPQPFFTYLKREEASDDEDVNTNTTGSSSNDFPTNNLSDAKDLSLPTTAHYHPNIDGNCNNITSVDCNGFTIEQVICLCQNLMNRKRFDLLAQCLEVVEQDFKNNASFRGDFERNEKILIAKVYAADHKNDIKTVKTILQTHKFRPEHHKTLKDLWFSAHYKERQNSLNPKRHLGAVDKYRIRKKYPPPKTIWDGEETKYCFEMKDRAELMRVFGKTKYPSVEEKRELTMRTKLNATQVSNWFKNRRQRDEKKGSNDDNMSLRNSSTGTPSINGRQSPFGDVVRPRSTLSSRERPSVVHYDAQRFNSQMSYLTEGMHSGINLTSYQEFYSNSGRNQVMAQQ